MQSSRRDRLEAHYLGINHPISKLNSDLSHKLKLLTESTYDKRDEVPSFDNENWDMQHPAPLVDLESRDSSRKSDMIE